MPPSVCAITNSFSEWMVYCHTQAECVPATQMPLVHTLPQSPEQSELVQ